MKKLRRKLSELFERGIGFIKKIKNTDKVLVIHHKDGDGIVSATIFLKVFERIGLEVSRIIASSNDEIEEVIKKVKDFDKTIILDIDICYLKEQLIDLDKDILLIDHHPPRNDLNREKVVYINPRLESPKVYQPASYIVYKFLSGITDLKDIEWLAALGTIRDFGLKDCEDVIGKWVDVKKGDIRNVGDLLKTNFWKNVKMLNGAVIELGYDNTLQILKMTKSLEKFVKNEEIKKAYQRADEKSEEMERTFWKNAREIKELNLFISEIETEYRALTSLLSSELSIKHPDKIIILMRKRDGKYAINARYQGSGINIGKLMGKVAKGLNGGGGHPHAAGATISEKNKDIFEERLIRELKKLTAKRR